MFIKFDFGCFEVGAAFISQYHISIVPCQTFGATDRKVQGEPLQLAPVINYKHILRPT